MILTGRVVSTRKLSRKITFYDVNSGDDGVSLVEVIVKAGTECVAALLVFAARHPRPMRPLPPITCWHKTLRPPRRRGHTVESVEAIRSDVHLGDVVCIEGMKDAHHSNSGVAEKAETRKQVPVTLPAAAPAPKPHYLHYLDACSSALTGATDFAPTAAAPAHLGVASKTSTS